MRKIITSIVAMLLGSCGMNYGRVHFPEADYAVRYEIHPETEERPERYQVVCVDSQNTTLEETYRDLEHLQGLSTTKGYRMKSRVFFADSSKRACSFDTLVHESRSKEKGKSEGYTLLFREVAPEGEVYVLNCGAAEMPEIEIKRQGSHPFFDSAENGCVFYGFPEAEENK